MWEVEVTRGDMVESRHALWGVAVGPDGAIRSETAPGDGDRVVFLRSAAKPFQAAGAAAAGVLTRFGLDPRHLAIACASHGGDEASVALVREILLAAGVDESSVRPGDDAQGGPLHHQCSGNHALALAWCAAVGWDLEGYLSPDHPVQQAMTDAVRTVAAGVAPVPAPDNCGMVTHGLPLRTIGTMFIALAARSPSLPGLAEVADAMTAHPELIGSDPGIDTELMVRNPSLVSKVGAEALTGAATPEVALVVRVGDGARRAMTPGVRALAAEWCGWSVEPTAGAAPGATVNRDARGRAVGELRAVRVEDPR